MGTSEVLFFLCGITLSLAVYFIVVVLKKSNTKNNAVIDELEEIKKSVSELQSQPTGANEVHHIDKNLDQTKDEFISFVSHELRAPMGAVKGLVSMMLKGDYGPTPERFRQPLAHVYVSAERQIRMINDILNISRFQSGRIRYTLLEFSLEQVTIQVVEEQQPVARQRRITLSVATGTDTKVQGDDIWVKQILDNVIGNAVKFTEEGSVTVTFRTRGDLAEVVVTDSGIGIDLKDQEKLFMKFQKLSGTLLQKTIGTGLGLYISREVSRKMGGDVRLERSDPGKGSTFVFSLPRAGSEIAAQTSSILEKQMLLSFNNSVGQQK